ncbi:hypothetical protein GCM10007897_35620 [Sphingobium jiangsuense]|uniref:Putative SnoaL-like aldol condensation-catalyzing enzyme n=1 Tax=Sphingobium jiangsuense TaxID=870476 RepID=A0A7W6BKF8_9SPHN|nr:nuclear transport factor 2 family protein [Sphingobium jiangsuense]MBB3928548.1 putative SnoaL-like aldol condensation-catalyzing enzyme [Sphingobium jiangsuense]GLT02157.1 hypothetical protein GCM10007897_35620 [Sphingobium jiangsuense]
MTDAGQSPEDRNTQIVLAMWEGVIGRGDREAVLKYIAPDYVQHAVNLPSGREHVLRLADMIREGNADFKPPARKTLFRTIAQGDMVVVIWEQQQDDPTRPGETYTGHAFDMYRLEDGMIVEHWDDTRKWPTAWKAKGEAAE